MTGAQTEILQLKNTTTKINSLEGINSRNGGKRGKSQ